MAPSGVRSSVTAHGSRNKQASCVGTLYVTLICTPHLPGAKQRCALNFFLSEFQSAVVWVDCSGSLADPASVSLHNTWAGHAGSILVVVPGWFSVLSWLYLVACLCDRIWLDFALRLPRTLLRRVRLVRMLHPSEGLKTQDSRLMSWVLCLESVFDSGCMGSA